MACEDLGLKKNSSVSCVGKESDGFVRERRLRRSKIVWMISRDGFSFLGNLHAPDCVASAKANPLRNRAVLLLGLGQLLLGSECLVALENHLLVSDLVSL